MSSELKELAIIAAICVPVGLAAGILLRLLAPDGCKKFAKWSVKCTWPFYLCFAVMFLGLASISFFVTHRYYFGGLFLAFAILEVLCLFRCGFKAPTQQRLKRIDEWNPRKLWPLWPSKQRNKV